MQKWVRKALVITFTILTFGLVSPPNALTMEEPKPDHSSKLNNFEQPNHKSTSYNIEQSNTEYQTDRFISYAVTQAEIQSLEKFGTKIKPVIEDEFRKIILPKIESVIAMVANKYPTENLEQLEISENPSGGNGEKIFHIYNKVNGQDIIRFHVRRDHPPQEGYWFNFHYHTSLDEFQKHHTLGEIYWNKNTPPQWMS